MANSDDDFWFWAFVVVLGGFLLFVFVLSRKIGADFESTLQSIIYSAVAAGLLYGIYKMLNPCWPVMLCLTAAFMYMAWFPAMDSIAMGGQAVEYWLQEEAPWWNGKWFRAGVLLALFSGAGFFLNKCSNSYRY